MVLAERNQRKRQVDRQSRDQFWKSKLGNRSLSTQRFDRSRASNRIHNINSSGIFSNDRQCIIELEELPENTIDDERSRFDFNMANYGTPQPASTRIFEDL
ncbi:Large ribosomal subunit protein [Trichinella spiralis]